MNFDRVLILQKSSIADIIFLKVSNKSTFIPKMHGKRRFNALP